MEWNPVVQFKDTDIRREFVADFQLDLLLMENETGNLCWKIFCQVQFAIAGY